MAPSSLVAGSQVPSFDGQLVRAGTLVTAQFPAGFPFLVRGAGKLRIANSGVRSGFLGALVVQSGCAHGVEPRRSQAAKGALRLRMFSVRRGAPRLVCGE